MEKLLNLFFTPKCTLCNKVVGGVLCKFCLQECKLIYSTNCIVCDRASVNGKTHTNCLKINERAPNQSFAMFEYDAYVRECIKNAKYSKKQFMALKVLLKHGILDVMRNGLKLDQNYICLPIPVSRKKFQSRGFNQAEIISKQISKSFGLKHMNNVLIRNLDTQHQHEKSRTQRYENLKNAFSINNKYTSLVKDRNFILVDDIWTSGATFKEASKVLKSAGALNVYCLALSKKEKMLKSKYDKFYLSTPTYRPSKTMA